MEDLIKREDAIRIAEYPHIGALTKEERVSLILDIPSADVVERKHGEWIEQDDIHGHYWECSECGIAVGLDDIRDFCCRCGADMRERKDNDSV